MSETAPSSEAASNDRVGGIICLSVLAVLVAAIGFSVYYFRRTSALSEELERLRSQTLLEKKSAILELERCNAALARSEAQKHLESNCASVLETVRRLELEKASSPKNPSAPTSQPKRPPLPWEGKSQRPRPAAR